MRPAWGLAGARRRCGDHWGAFGGALAHGANLAQPSSLVGNADLGHPVLIPIAPQVRHQVAALPKFLAESAAMRNA